MSNLPDPPPLKQIQARFAIYVNGGEFFMVDTNEISQIKAGTRVTGISFYKKPQAELKLKRYIEEQGFLGNPIELIRQFWISPNTHEYKLTAFSPLHTALDTINFWVGCPINSNEGNWDLIRDFLFEIICDKNPMVFDYVLKFLAHMLQKPEEKPGIILVLLGAQGTGKGTLFRILQSIWLRTTLLVSDAEHVIGNFNAALELNYVICMDEALFVGDKKALDRLKSLITEPTCRIEQKYQPSRIIDSYHRFIATSNRDQFAHVEADDRRFLFLRVSKMRQEDLEYFDSIYKELKKPAVIEAMIFDLMNLDLTQFNVRQRPKTQEHTHQKIQSLTGFDRFWYEVLLSKSLTSRDDSSGTAWCDPQFISTVTLQEHYKAFDKNSERYGATQSQQIAHHLLKICPSASAGRGKIGYQNKQVRGYNLPSIAIARKEFEDSIGAPLDWPEEAIDIKAILKPYLSQEGAHP